MQDTKNRQNSLPCDNLHVSTPWADAQERVYHMAREIYEQALASGIAKEVARAVLPEGLTPSRLYMTGSVRSWLHYIAVRTDPTTQKEHRDVAAACADILYEQFPVFKP